MGAWVQRRLVVTCSQAKMTKRWDFGENITTKNIDMSYIKDRNVKIIYLLKSSVLKIKQFKENIDK